LGYSFRVESKTEVEVKENKEEDEEEEEEEEEGGVRIFMFSFSNRLLHSLHERAVPCLRKLSISSNEIKEEGRSGRAAPP